MCKADCIIASAAVGQGKKKGVNGEMGWV